MEIKVRRIYIFACILGAVSIIVLALAAHALKNKLSSDQLESIKSAGEIQLFHSILIVALLLAVKKDVFVKIKTALSFMLSGITCFSFSIYLLTAREFLQMPFLKFLWPVTPIGGLLLIISWLLLIPAARKS